MADQLPPSALEAEMATAGCVLLDAPYSLGVLAKNGIGPRYFYDLRCSEVIRIAAELHRGGSAVDDILLIPRLKSAGVEIEWHFLDSLRNATPSAANVEYYIPDLKEAFLRRSVMRFAQLATTIATNGASLDQLNETAEQFTHYIRHSCELDNLPAITTGTEALASQLPEPPEIVEGLLHQGTKAALGGGSKSNKTWGLIDCGVSVAHGEPFWSMKTRKSRVLYANLELPAWSFQRRLQAIRMAKNIIEPNLLELWHLRGHVAPYDVLLPKIRERIREAEYGLVILDPIYKIMGDLKENSAEDMTKLMNAIEALSVECGCAIIFGAHFSKGNQAAKESMDRISGSGVFARDPDTIMVMTRHEEDNAFTIEATLRNLKPVEPFVIRWDYPLFRRDESLDPSKLKSTVGKKSQFDAVKLLSAIVDRTAGNPISVSEWAALTDIKRQTLTDYTAKLRLADFIRTIGEGSKARQFITEKGIALVAGNGGQNA